MGETEMEYETTMSVRGQIVIVKEVREQLHLKPQQKFIEMVEDGEIVLKPLVPLSKAGGMLKGMETQPTLEVIKEIKEGWK